ncbi:hypothetical protein E3N88_08096 [Mikania micrantha]|uniref:Uncharacterized protein n=1 Tax=Mikania micrantha TaxID=192012 RepID=A0A5N6PH81_9ASTR|nr:hypothetical protein E3N88_08096 [Mikania micrantha]
MSGSSSRPEERSTQTGHKVNGLQNPVTGKPQAKNGMLNQVLIQLAQRGHWSSTRAGPPKENGPNGSCMNIACVTPYRVVCRLKKNDGFRLNESSRGFSENRISSAADNYHQSASNTQTIVGDEFEAKSCSLDSKSSFRSDSESVSDLQLIADLPSGYSTPFKEGDIEDDCFADIINDDIIKLDESGSHSLILHGVLSGTKYTEMLPPETLSNQGTAVRRFRRPKGHNNRTKHGNPSSKNDHNQTSSDKKVPGCVFSILGGNANTLSRFHPLYLVFLFLFILLVAWRVDRIEVATRQLWYWVRKGADCL